MPSGGESKEEGHSGGMSMYVRFMAMIAASTVVMFVLMYFNTYTIDHFFWSDTRFWMAFVMGAAMMVVMLGFMWSMYENRTKRSGFRTIGHADLSKSCFGLSAANASALQLQVCHTQALRTTNSYPFQSYFIRHGSRERRCPHSRHGGLDQRQRQVNTGKERVNGLMSFLSSLMSSASCQNGRYLSIGVRSR